MLSGVAGLLAGTLIVGTAPFLVRHRRPEVEGAPLAAGVPILGPFLARYRPARAVALELALAAICAGLAVRYGWSVKLLIGAVYAAILVLIADIDLDYRLVLNLVSYPAVVLALIGSVLWPGLGIESAAIGAAAGLVLFGALQLIGRGALGTGDTKLAILIGAMRGFPAALNALLLGVIIGGVVAAFLWFVLRRDRKAFFAYAPYLAAGAIVSFFLVNP